MAGEVDVDAFDGAREPDIGVDVALEARVAFSVGLHGRGLALVGEEDDEIDVVP